MKKIEDPVAFLASAAMVACEGLTYNNNQNIFISCNIMNDSQNCFITNK